MKNTRQTHVSTIVVSALVLQGALSNAQSGPLGNASANEAIRPFSVNIPKKTC